MKQKYLFYREDSERFRAFLRERRIQYMTDFHKECQRWMREDCPSYSWMLALYKGEVGFTFQFYSFMVEHFGFEQNLKPENRLNWENCAPEIMWIDPVSQSHQIALPGFRQEQISERKRRTA